MFIFRRKKLMVDFFTDVPWVEGVTDISMAGRSIPSWWKGLPKPKIQSGSPSEELNMRHCPGILDYFGKSLALPLWADFKIFLEPQGQSGFIYEFANPAYKAVEHPAAQRGSFLPAQEYQHLKLESPWLAQCRESIDWVVSQPLWCFQDPSAVIAPPGVLNFNNTHETNVNLFFQRQKHTLQHIFIGAGTPLVFMTPMTDRKVVIRKHLLTKGELSSKFPDKTTYFIADCLRRRGK